MYYLNLFLSITPIIVILVGFVVLKKPGVFVSPVALVYTAVLALLFFKTEGSLIVTETYGGIIGGLKIILLLFSAFTLLALMKDTGAMNTITGVMTKISNDRRILTVLVAFCFGTFLEGVSGAGTPAAIAAPFLVGLGFDPVTSVSAALISNGIPPSFGGAGLATISGSEPVREVVSIASASSATGRFFLVGGLILPLLLVGIIFGKKAYKGLVGFLVFIGAVYGISIFAISNFIGPELAATGTGVLTILACLGYVKAFKAETPAEYFCEVDNSQQDNGISPIIAFLPYLCLLVFLPLVRFTVDIQLLMKPGYTIWISAVILVCMSIGAIGLKVSSRIPKYLWQSFKNVLPAAISMCALFALSNIMNKAGLMSIIANSLSNTGKLYPVAAVLIGTMGAFMTGSAAGSNIMFSPLHIKTGNLVGLNPGMLFGAQSGGGSVGNIICPNNVIAASTTVGMKNAEGTIMRRVFLAWAVLIVLYSILAVLYTNVLFPNF